MVQSQGPPLSRFSLTGLNCSAGPATAPAFVVDVTAIRRLGGVRAVAPQWCGRGPHPLTFSRILPGKPVCLLTVLGRSWS